MFSLWKPKSKWLALLHEFTAIVSWEKGTTQEKIKTLGEAGVAVIESPAKIGTVMLEVFKHRGFSFFLFLGRREITIRLSVNSYYCVWWRSDWKWCIILPSNLEKALEFFLICYLVSSSSVGRAFTGSLPGLGLFCPFWD